MCNARKLYSGFIIEVRKLFVLKVKLELGIVEYMVFWFMIVVVMMWNINIINFGINFKLVDFW